MGKGSARGAHGSYDGIVTIILMPAFCGELAFILSNFLVWGLASTTAKDLCSGPAKYVLGMGCIWLFAVCAHCCIVYSDACRGGEAPATFGFGLGVCSVLALIAMSIAGAVLLAGNSTCRDAGEGIWAMALADVVIHLVVLVLIPLCGFGRELVRACVDGVRDCCRCMCRGLCGYGTCDSCCRRGNDQPRYNDSDIDRYYNPHIRHNVNLRNNSDNGPPQWHRDVSLDLPPARRNNNNRAGGANNNARAGPPGNVARQNQNQQQQQQQQQQPPLVNRVSSGSDFQPFRDGQPNPALVAPDAPPLAVIVDAGAAAVAGDRNAGPPGGAPVVNQLVPTEAPVFLDPAGLGKALTDDSVAVHVTVRIPNRAKYPVYQLNLPKSWSVGSAALAILERLEVSPQYTYQLLDTSGDELDERLEVSALADEQRIARLLMRYR